MVFTCFHPYLYLYIDMIYSIKSISIIYIYYLYYVYIYICVCVCVLLQSTVLKFATCQAGATGGARHKGAFKGPPWSIPVMNK